MNLSLKASTEFQPRMPSFLGNLSTFHNTSEHVYGRIFRMHLPNDNQNQTIPVPTLETNRLILRPLCLADAPQYSEQFIDYEVIRHLAGVVGWPYPENGVVYFLENMSLPHQGKTRWSWTIRQKQNPDQLMGCIDLWREGHPENRGFWLGRKFWVAGYMTEAAEAVNRFAFESLGFEKLIFSNAVGNKRSGRVKEKTGALFVRTEPAAFVDPQYTMREVYELTKERWSMLQTDSKG